jgi:hypothetical protein
VLVSLQGQILDSFRIADYPETIQPSASKALRYWAE